MHLFYDPLITKNITEYVLPEDESKHIVRVLRLKEGDKVGVLDGKGRVYSGEIISSDPKKCRLKIINIDLESESDYSIHIAIAPTKLMERMEWFVEKATELGVTEITLLQSKNSERIKVREDRLVKKAVSALKQSKRTFLPKINSIVTVEQFIKMYPSGLIAHCYEGEKSSIMTEFNLKNCPMLIGPEGDFSPDEVQFALKSGYKSISLGKNRLRTETAALYACMQAVMKTEHL